MVECFVFLRPLGLRLTAADLNGRTVVGPKGTILHQLLLAAAEKAGLGTADYSYVNMDISAGVAAMAAGSADAALVAGPAVAQAQKSGAHIVTTGEGYLDATIVIAVRGKFLEEHKDLVKRYLDVHSKALKFMADNPEATYDMVAAETGLTADEVKTMYTMYDFNPAITDKDIADLEATQQFLIDNGMMTKKVDIKSIISEQ